uniref:Exonuclease domain-containing protein n=1 Tax=Rhabditophanes sp. KR3021 TaxID=114890 RepID=A0AC35U7L6_9BILA
MDDFDIDQVDALYDAIHNSSDTPPPPSTVITNHLDDDANISYGYKAFFASDNGFNPYNPDFTQRAAESQDNSDIAIPWDLSTNQKTITENCDPATFIDLEDRNHGASSNDDQTDSYHYASNDPSSMLLLSKNVGQSSDKIDTEVAKMDIEVAKRDNITLNQVRMGLPQEKAEEREGFTINVRKALALNIAPRKVRNAIGNKTSFAIPNRDVQMHKNSPNISHFKRPLSKASDGGSSSFFDPVIQGPNVAKPIVPTKKHDLEMNIEDILGPAIKEPVQVVKKAKISKVQSKPNTGGGPKCTVKAATNQASQLIDGLLPTQNRVVIKKDRVRIVLKLKKELIDGGLNETQATNIAAKKELKIVEVSTTSKGYLSKAAHEMTRIRKKEASPFGTKPRDANEFDEKDLGKFYNYLTNKFLLSKAGIEENNFPVLDPEKCGAVKSKSLRSLTDYLKPFAKPNDLERACERCKKCYNIVEDSLEPTIPDPGCIYHKDLPRNRIHNGSSIYSYMCCDQSLSSTGCASHTEHTTVTQPYADLYDYLSPPDATSNEAKVYAIDCEMVSTLAGRECARITMTDVKNQVIFDQLILPKYRVTDYQSAYSGITKELLKDVKLSLTEARNKLFKLIDKDTILIGHSLDSDLHTMRIIHQKIVDTSVVFPHKKIGFKRALRNIASEKIQLYIQQSLGGHDSAEDSIACMKLMIAKFQNKI